MCQEWGSGVSSVGYAEHVSLLLALPTHNLHWKMPFAGHELMTVQLQAICQAILHTAVQVTQAAAIN